MRLRPGSPRQSGSGRSRALEELPLLWDCDFLHGDPAGDGVERYVLCEINVSSVSPFPDSAIEPLVAATQGRLESARRRS